MKLFGNDRMSDLSAERPTAQPDTDDPIDGDRGIPSVNRTRSVQSRISSVLAIAFMSSLGLGLLTWYYAKTLARPSQARHAAQVALKSRAQGDMALPPLSPVASPTVRAEPPPISTGDPPSESAVERLLGPAPPPPGVSPAVGPSVAPSGDPAYPTAGSPSKSPGELAFERRLAGPAFARLSREDGAPTPPQGMDVSSLAGAHAQGPGQSSDSPQSLNTLLHATVTPAVAASVLPTRRFLLAKGAFIDCTLETAIDSTLPGMTTCITATDTFSADGSVVLLERGTKLVGETRGQVQQGSARIFVLWSEARTPTGVVVPLSSPATDELGRSGLPGEVNRHFWDRFGAAILLTVVNGAVQGAVNSQNRAGSISISPASSTDVMSEVLRSTVAIAPTVTKAQGDRIQVFVARDVDFRSVYSLRVASSDPSGKGS